MSISRPSAAALALSTGVLGMLLAGCSSSGPAKTSAPDPSAPTPKLSGENLIARVADRMSASPDQVVCPQELVGTVGSTTTCRLTSDDGSKWDVLVTVSSVQGSEIAFGIDATRP
ncbi:DUF4333 domain-containing protein [Streptomyces sp. NPDC048623]|uniref:DUF4333 domain-containing protein n=1 Tax=Streptomyces sp. NPDC048623 TaxID=3155761 RepID=UPI00343FBD79